MKRTNLKLMIVAIIVVAAKSLNAQDDGNGSWGPGSEVQSDPCIQTATTWFLGGNNIAIPPPPPPPNGNVATAPHNMNTEVGTCNNFPFVLKANNNNCIFIQPSTRIGIGLNNAQPTAQLDIMNNDPSNPANTSHFRIYADQSGNLESTTGINTNYATGNDYRINEGTATGNVNRFWIENTTGNVGVGALVPLSAKLDVQDANDAEIHAFTNSNNPASLWVLNKVNAASGFALQVDASGIGHIAQNINSPNNLINFRYNTSNTIPEQVWIGKKPVSGSHTDFNLAVGGKIVAHSVYVTNQSNQWADYVFEKDYKLPKLSDVEAFYKKNKHLPEIPNAAEVGENGVSLGEMNTLLLKKVEELTIYMVEQQKKIAALEEKVYSKK